MDHLCLPSNPTRPPPRVRYVAQAYDGGPFLEYPDRHPLLHSARLDEFESFLQTWLYYGLLSETLGPAFDHQKYVERDGFGPYVCSTSLYHDLDSWVALSREWSPQYRNATLTHLALCLERASIFMLFSRGYDQAIRQSVAALGEAVSEAVICAADEGFEPTLSSVWILLYANDDLHEHMRRNGWCPSEISKTTELLHTVDALYFAERLSRPDPGAKHQNCTDHICLGAQIDTVTYHPQHVGACECESVGPPLHRVMQCLTAGTYPVLRLAGHSIEEVSVDVVPYRDHISYVALSHVWSQGLGNPHQMQLPRCQILRLRGMIDDLQRQGFCGSDDAISAETHGIFLWCDTLCCPAELHLKPLALGKMREVYENAKCVLVLDQSLTHHDTGATDLREASMRLLTSTWTGRLWTLQEAALAPKLLIQFADRILDMNDLVSAARAHYNSGLSTRAIDQDISRCLLRSTGFMLRTSTRSHVTWALAAESVRFRQASNPSDEALCLATLLGLDLQPLTRVEPGERMEVLWRMLAQTAQGIPQDIIFNGFRRLDKAGLRWAPASLIDSDAIQRRVVTPTDTDGREELRGELTPQGLRVSSPALQIRASIQPSDGTIRDLSIPFETFWHKVQLRHHDGHWYEISYLDNDVAPADPTLWQRLCHWPGCLLVLSQLPERDELGGQNALFTSHSQSVDDVMVLHSHLNVVIHRTSGQEDHLWEATVGSGRILREELESMAQSDGATKARLEEMLIIRSKELAHLVLQRSGAQRMEDLYIPRMGVASEDPTIRAATMIAILCLGRYLTTAQEYAEETSWIID